MDSDFYQTGILVSFTLWLYQSIWLVIYINSRLEKNLNKVSQRLSWLTLNPKLIESRDEINPKLYKMIIKYLFITLIGLLFVFLSWLNVFYVLVNNMFGRFKRDGEPEPIKTFKWKMRNLDLNYDQILEELHKIDFTGVDFKQFKKNYEDQVRWSLGEN